MTRDVAISVEQLSKTYLVKQSANTLRNYLGQVFLKKEISRKEVLKNISFQISKGSCVGLIGSNGAGKSTLLKILSKIVWPSKGRIQINGPLSAMLEVGTGFYPDLTGRENIFLSGALLGMSKADIKRHLDDIIDFAGVGTYIDSPVRYYSSGMYVRLGFAVASFLKQEILIIDEILAVGDAEFRKRCVNLMRDGSQNEGKTCLIVSHNLPMIQSLCERSLLIKEGRLVFDGTSNEAIDQYLGMGKALDTVFSNEHIQIKDVRLNARTSETHVVGAGDEVAISFNLETEREMKSCLLRLQIRQGQHNVAVLNNTISNHPFSNIKGSNTFICRIPRLQLNEGIYQVDLDIMDGQSTLIQVNPVLEFEVSKGFFFPSSILPNVTRGALLLEHSWDRHE